MTTIESNKGDVGVTDLAEAAAWIDEMRPAFVSVDGESVDYDGDDGRDEILAAITAAAGGGGPVTIKSLTDGQIKTLMAEAFAADDHKMGVTCRIALGQRFDRDDYTTLEAYEARDLETLTQRGAQLRVVRSLNDARAQAD